MDIIINSESYWNNRFENDWKQFNGSEQTRFFAKLICELLPEWFVKIIRNEKYTVCDVGCALGEGVDIFNNFFHVPVDGGDFSESAIENAKKMFPSYKFFKIDVNNLPSDFEYDVVICSNILEHFENPWEVINNLSKVTKQYMVLMCPYQETLDIKEHVYKFDRDIIPMTINDYSLVYCDVIDGAKVPESFYPDQQILILYSRDEQDKMKMKLSDFKNIDLKLQNQLNKITNQNDNLWNRISEQTTQIDEQKKQIDEQKKQIDEQKKQIDEQKKQIDEQKKQIDELEIVVEEKNEESNLLTEKVNQAEITIQNAIHQCMLLAQTRPFKLAHFLHRFKYQWLHGSKEERKNFQNWITTKITKHSGDFDRRYNQIYGLISILDSVTLQNESANHNGTSVEKNSDNLILSDTTKACIQECYQKFDVIILAIIDYDFRFQRPQHFATRFAENGHRVFYVNANHYKPYSIKMIRKNLHEVNIHNNQYNAIHLTDWKDQMTELISQMDRFINEYAVRDAIIVVDYPNWIHGAKYLKDKYGFSIITDYMDDFTGFLNPTENLVKNNCEIMLTDSDKIVASSQFLHDIARRYKKNIPIIRNGTEYEFFHTAYTEIISEKKIIGYYGAVAEWFDFEKISYLAQRLPDCEIMIIGNVTAGEAILKKHKNIRLLGEKPYKELPRFLEKFDVCLIPFDTSTDLIKATNPVKFYEYLSAGKKIVATEIPELAAYKDKYVYMTNSNEDFLRYVIKCLEGSDSLATAEECMRFANENDWQHRYEAFYNECKEMVPKISIIVLTYNNLKLNKLCINSILEKTAYPNYELIVVDNCSTDGTCDYLADLEKHYENVKIVLNKENRGFAGGNNDGIKIATGEYIVLLNNDTIVTRGWLTAMKNHFSHDPSLALVGPVTNSIGNESKIKVEYNTTSKMHQFAYKYTTEHMNEEYRDIRVLALFCTMIKKEMIEKYGGLDEGYGIGMFEDDDYSEAAKYNGFTLTVAEDAFVHHFAGASFKKLEDEKYKKIFDENKKYFEKKWNTRWIMHECRPGVKGEDNLDIDLLQEV